MNYGNWIRRFVTPLGSRRPFEYGVLLHVELVLLQDLVADVVELLA